MSAPTVMKLHVEGWRRINHSYALVNRNHLRWLLKDPRLSITHREMPYFKAHWAANPNHSFPEAFEAVLNLPDQNAPPDVDITLRMDFPHRFDKPARGKLVVFGTTEYTHISPENLRGDVAAAASDPEVFILTPSQWSAQGFLKLGFPQERVWVLPHGVDKEHFRITTPEEKARYRALLGIDQTAKVFLHVGGGWFGKGLDLLIEAFSIHAKSHPRSRLVIKGHDALYGNAVLNAFANRPLSLPPGVELAREQILYLGGDLSDESMDHLYRLADCYVATYRGEGFNMPLLEAAARGLEVIATAGGASDDFLPFFARVLGITSQLLPLTEDQKYLQPNREALINALNLAALRKDSALNDDVHLIKATKRLTWETLTADLTDRLCEATTSTRNSQHSSSTRIKNTKDKSIHATSHIVFVHVGDNPPPPTLISTVKQALLIAPLSQVWIVIEAKFFERLVSMLKVQSRSLQLISTAELNPSEEHKTFKRTTALPSGEHSFWKHTTERFFFVNDLLNEYQLQRVIHLESDVIIYEDVPQRLSGINPQFEMAYPLDRTRGIGSVVYFRDKDASKHFCRFAIENDGINDMELLGKYFQRYQGHKVSALPTLPRELCNDHHIDPTRYAPEGLDQLGLFDAAAIGQYIDGIDPIHDRSLTRGFINEGIDLSPEYLGLTWTIDGGLKRLQACGVEDKKVNNIHVHSKRTRYFESTNHCVPESEEEIITGERIMCACDVVLTTHEKIQFHKVKEKNQPNYININDFHKNGTTFIHKDLFKRLDDAEVIHCYGDHFSFFTSLIAPHLENPHIIVVHNSDIEIDTSFDRIFQNSNIKHVLGMNMLSNHPNTIGIPAGLANPMWPHGDTKTFFTFCQSLKKRKRIYAGGLSNTHPSRVPLQRLLSDLRFAKNMQARHDFATHLCLLGQSSHVICPRGNAVESHRLWETLYMGGIPVITKQELHAALPTQLCLVLDSWEELRQLDLAFPEPPPQIPDQPIFMSQITMLMNTLRHRL